jgi:predicted ribosome quality control (RQC) complex YloA/Tae2 family protein
MDALAFLMVADALFAQMDGARIDKIFQPDRDVWVLTLRGVRDAKYLVVGKSGLDGAVYLSDFKPENPHNPSARAMKLRKQLKGRRLAVGAADVVARKAAFQLSPGEGKYLVLDLSGGGDPAPLVSEELPEGFGANLDWPPVERVLDDPEVWREYPHVSPLLRRTMQALTAAEAYELYDRVGEGRFGEGYVYEHETEPAKTFLSAWKLPEALQKNFTEHKHPDILSAAGDYGRKRLFRSLARKDEDERAKRLKAERKKIKRMLANVEADEKRLTGMIAEARQGELLRGALYMLKADEKLAQVEVPGMDGEMQSITLDPKLGVKDNMALFFKRAAKGRRGLEFATGRREELEAAFNRLERGEFAPDELLKKPLQAQQKTKKSIMPGKADRWKGMDVSAFRSSDGFLMLRGKNSKANHAMLSKVAAHDLWFHAKGVPSAHVILRLDYPEQDVPLATMHEAAALSGLKSALAAAGKAEVMCALVKDVRKVKGLKHGSVRVDNLKETVFTELDPDLEEKLRLNL